MAARRGDRRPWRTAGPACGGRQRGRFRRERRPPARATAAGSGDAHRTRAGLSTPDRSDARRRRRGSRRHPARQCALRRALRRGIARAAYPVDSSPSSCTRISRTSWARSCAGTVRASPRPSGSKRSCVPRMDRAAGSSSRSHRSPYEGQAGAAGDRRRDELAARAGATPAVMEPPGRRSTRWAKACSRPTPKGRIVYVEQGRRAADRQDRCRTRSAIRCRR